MMIHELASGNFFPSMDYFLFHGLTHGNLWITNSFISIGYVRKSGYPRVQRLFCPCLPFGASDER